MRATIGRMAVAAALVGLVGATPAAAQQLSLGGFNVDGQVEAGGRILPGGEPSGNRRTKFEEYRDITQGAFLQDFQLRLRRPDESYFIDFGGAKWGQLDQEFAATMGRLGLWELGLQWDEMPHLFNTGARTLSNDAVHGQFSFSSLANPRPFLNQWLHGRVIDEIETQWDTGRLSFKLTPTPEWDLTAAYTRIKKDGDKPGSIAWGSPGNNFRDILFPVDETIHDLRLKAVWARENWQLQFGYTFSLYENALRGAFADNQCFNLTGSGTNARAAQCGTDGITTQPNGLVSLPPSNQAHTISIAGGLTLPFNTRVSGNAAYSLRFQNDPFLAHTINPFINVNDSRLRLPRRGLDGIVGTTTVYLQATNRPVPPLSLTAKYRLFDLNDMTNRITFPGTVINDRPPIGGPAMPERSSYTKQNADLDAKWRLGGSTALLAGVGWERWDRSENREVPHSNEYFAKAGIEVSPADWITARLTYRPSYRRVNYFNEDNVALGGMRKFDESSRNRQRVDLLLSLTPVETLTTTLTASWRDDDYIDSPYGLQQGTGWSAGFDVTWTPIERLTMSAGYVHEYGLERQRQRTRFTPEEQFPDFDWISNNVDYTDTASFNVLAAIIPNKLDWKLGTNYTLATSDILTRNPFVLTSSTFVNQTAARAKRFPGIENSLLRVDTALRYHFAKAWTVALSYAYETFGNTDWRINNLPAWIAPQWPLANNALLPSSYLFFGNDSKNYDAHILTLTLAYRFGR